MRAARKGARKGSRARVGSESAKEPRKEGEARRAGSGKLTPPSEHGGAEELDGGAGGVAGRILLINDVESTVLCTFWYKDSNIVH